MTLRHIRCFLRDDTDRIIMNAVNCYEKEQLVEATQEKVAFLNAVAHGAFSLRYSLCLFCYVELLDALICTDFVCTCMLVITCLLLRCN